MLGVAVVVSGSASCGTERRLVTKIVPPPTPKVAVKVKRTPKPTPRPTRSPSRSVARVASAPKSGVIALIHRIFGSHGREAVGVFGCESRHDPAARNGPHRGLAQINVYIHAARIAAMGYTADDMFRAEPNLRVAKALFDEQGWRPWTCRWAA